jgi:hypothetical protein
VVSRLCVRTEDACKRLSSKEWSVPASFMMMNDQINVITLYWRMYLCESWVRALTMVA